MSYIRVNTDALEQYSIRINKVHWRIQEIVWRCVALVMSFEHPLEAIQLQWHMQECADRLAACADYCAQTAADFSLREQRLLELDPLTYDVSQSQWEDLCFDIGCAIQTGASSIRGFVEFSIEDYQNKGFTYRLLEYGKAIIKTAADIASIVKDVPQLFTGAGTPGAVLDIISSVNDITNNMSDIGYIYNEEYDKIGTTDHLRDAIGPGAYVIEYGSIIFNAGASASTLTKSMHAAEKCTKIFQKYFQKGKAIVKFIEDIGKDIKEVIDKSVDFSSYYQDVLVPSAGGGGGGI